MNIDDYGQARSYYDNEVASQIRDWLYFNPRQRKAVAASISGIGRVETAIEFGSGIGTCGELFAQETQCRVLSLDLSNELIRMGNRMFGGDNHTYTEGTLEELSQRLDHKVDMILLYDVLEHILPADWEGLFDAFGSLLAQEGQVFISTPTPWYQDFLKENQPSGLQPVDLSITKEDVQAIGERIGLQLIQHEVVDVFREGDYQYFWLASSGGEFERKNLQKDSLLRRHWLLLRKLPRLYVKTFSIKLLWVAVKSTLLGGRKIISRDQMGAAS